MLYEYEKRHAEYVRNNGAECCVLLKKDGHFPVKEAKKLALYGSGARATIKGGTGSGEVNSRYFITAEEGIKEAGFEITSGAWMDAYDKIKKDTQEAFIRDIKAQAKAHHENVFTYSMGKAPLEPVYEFELDGEGDMAVYVLGRISGEGSDREPKEGDILLSSTEIRDILACNEKYENFMLVINAGGVVDLTPVMGVKNILVLSQLGADTGHILADIILGKQNPSGKLTTTWAAWNDYQTVGDFGEKHDTRYKEGIYVGYRYFDSKRIAPLFPFGYGLSYTEFEIHCADVSLLGDTVCVEVDVKNTGDYAGKEVVEVYTSVPAKELNQPWQTLSAFAKTSLLAPGQTQRLHIEYKLSELASYHTQKEYYCLEEGDYIVRVGAHSRDTDVCAAITVDETIVVRKAKNVLGSTDFEDLCIQMDEKEILPEGCKKLHFDAKAIACVDTDYTRSSEICEEVDKLSTEKLIKLNIGAYKPGGGVTSIIGNAGFTVAGAAGQTNMDAGFASMVMADGPAGLRLNQTYAVDKKGEIHSLESALPAFVMEVMDKPSRWFFQLLRYKPKKTDELRYQYATAIPIGTAIAQSFNIELATEFGNIVGEEMEQFGVHLWLAPALNIHRSIRCGRNFEYYSEDPLISGAFAAAITSGVQSHPHAATTIKHYAFNNQERNRTQNNSMISERAAREIYLRGFEICVRQSRPKAVMTSYNLINGTHTSEHEGLIQDILRAEYGFDGIVMTDWVVAGFESEKGCMHPVADAGRVAKAGGNVFMPGSQLDYKRIEAALESGELSEQQLKINATALLKMAKSLVK